MRSVFGNALRVVLCVVVAVCATTGAAWAADVEIFIPGDYKTTADWNEKSVQIGPGSAKGDITVTVEGNAFDLTKAGDSDYLADTLAINSSDDGAVSLNITDTKSPGPIIFNSTADLKGTAINSATLTISNAGNALLVNDTFTLDQYSTLTVNNGAVLRTGAFTMSGADTPGAANVFATIGGAGAGSRLIIAGDGTVGANSTLTISAGGSVRTKGKMEVHGSDATLVLNGGVIDQAKNSVLTVSGGGVLSAATGTSHIGYKAPDDPYYNKYPYDNTLPTTETEDPDVPASYGVHIATDGRLAVDAGATLDIDMLWVTSARYNGEAGATIAGTGDLQGKWLSMYGSGSVDVETDATLSFGAISIEDFAELNVSGSVTDNPAATETSHRIVMSGGTVNIESGGNVIFPTLDATGGIINVKNGGKANIDSFSVAGTTVLNVNSGGTIDLNTDLSIGGSAEATFASGAIIGDATGIAHLAVGGNATLDNFAGVVARSFTFSGGAINMQRDSTLTAETSTGEFSTMMGKLNFLDDTARVNFRGDVVFGRGGVFVLNGATGHLNLDNAGVSSRLEVGKDAVFDTSQGNLLAENVSNFTLNGTLHVGWDKFGVLKTTVTGIDAAGGELSVGKDATVTMTGDMQRQALASFATGGLQVLKTDAATASGLGTLYWDNVSVVYEYEVRQDADGTYGIWVVDSQSVSRDILYEQILEQWRKREQIGDDVGKVINQSFLDAIVDANDLVIGAEPGYETLTASGQFNADVLASFINPDHSGAGYDALMLYNGSGMAMASQAAVSANSKILRGINRRSENLRREIRGNDVIDPDSYCPEPLPAGRVWADAIYHADNSGHDQAFAGYEHRGMGLTVGYDRLYGDLAVGGAASYLGGRFEDGSALDSDSRIDTFAIDLYSTLTHPCGWFVSGALGYGYSDNRLRDRRVLNGIEGWNHADFGAHTLSVSATAGRDFWFGDYLTVSPSVGLEYIGTRSNSHTQYFIGDDRAGGASTLSPGQVRNHSMSFPLNLAMSYNLMGDEESLLTLTGNVGYAYELNNDGASGDINYDGLQGHVGPVRMASRSPGRHMFSLGLRGRYVYRQYEFGLGYDYVGKRKYNAHSLTLNAGMSF